MSFAKKALLLSSLLALGAGVSASAAPALNGAGASFPAKIYQRWFSELAKSGGPKVNYQAVGSGSGRKAFIDQTVNFGASDDPMKKTDMAKVKRGNSETFYEKATLNVMGIEKLKAVRKS